jgi:hypothetical protein
MPRTFLRAEAGKGKRYGSAESFGTQGRPAYQFFVALSVQPASAIAQEF